MLADCAEGGQCQAFYQGHSIPDGAAKPGHGLPGCPAAFQAMMLADEQSICQVQYGI